MSYESQAQALYQQIRDLHNLLEDHRQEHEFPPLVFSRMLQAIAAEMALHDTIAAQAAAERTSRLIKPELQS